MPEAQKQILVERTLAAVGPAAVLVRDFALVHLDPLAASDVELAVVETLTNAIKHGDVHGRETQSIIVRLLREPKALLVEILDQSPLVPEGMLERVDGTMPDMDSCDLDRLSESGRGLALIVLTMDEVTLEADEAHFTLRMRKRTS